MLVALVGVLGLGAALVLALREPADASGQASENRKGSEPRPARKDMEEIRKAVQTYVAAFNKGDLKALMAHWSADAEFLEESGKTIRGRDALKARFAKTFKDSPGMKIRIAVKTLRFVKPDVAIVDGIVKLTGRDGSSDNGPYSSIWTKTDGKWLMTRVYDLPGEGSQTTAPNYEMLKELEWLVGDWASEGKHTPVTFSCKWIKNQNFLRIEETIHLKDQDPMTITEIIGWDPIQQKIRSWLFDSRGGFGETLWTRNGNQWTVELMGVLSDGRAASSRSIWKYVDEKTCTWDSLDREIDGQPAPDVNVKYVRKAPKK
jgi:uncharacterized protein (TIGR02246 family)